MLIRQTSYWEWLREGRCYFGVLFKMVRMHKEWCSQISDDVKPPDLNKMTEKNINKCKNMNNMRYLKNIKRKLDKKP